MLASVRPIVECGAEVWAPSTRQKWAAIDRVQTDIIIKCAMRVGHERPCTSSFLSHAHWPRASWRRTQKSTTELSTMLTL
jgi:hypothetical protein